VSAWIFTEAELVFLVEGGTVAHALNLESCAILSRLVHRRPDRALVVPDRSVPPYTHTVMLGMALFRVRAEVLTEEEAQAIGLSRRVTAEEVDGAGLQRSLPALPVAVGVSPGEAVQEAIVRGIPGWSWRP
jgi:hypothetical protein